MNVCFVKTKVYIMYDRQWIGGREPVLRIYPLEYFYFLDASRQLDDGAGPS